MPKQPALHGLRDAMEKKVTRGEQFLVEMDTVVPWWSRLLGLLAPHYPTTGPKDGRPPMPLAAMLRVYFLQNWYALSDPMSGEALHGSDAMRRFAGIGLGDDCIPDEIAILNFRHLLEKHGLTDAVFADVNAHLAGKGIPPHSGMLVDATTIDVPSFTKHKAKTRAPAMSSTGKGNDWYFGSEEDRPTVQWAVGPTNAHLGVNLDSGVIHSLDITTAKVHGSRIWDELLHRDETAAWADKGHVSTEREAAFKGRDRARAGVSCARHRKVGDLHPLNERINRIIAMVREKVEHPFHVPKREFGYVKTRYRGLAKNRAQLFTLFALGNPLLGRRWLMT